VCAAIGISYPMLMFHVHQQHEMGHDSPSSKDITFVGTILLHTDYVISHFAVTPLIVSPPSIQHIAKIKNLNLMHFQQVSMTHRPHSTWTAHYYPLQCNGSKHQTNIIGYIPSKHTRRH
jgi:hypothetical protein